MRENVDHARGEASERGLEVHRRELDLGLVAQRCGGDRLAQIDVEALTLAFVVLGRKSGRRQRHAALDHAVGLDVVEDIGLRSIDAGQCDNGSQTQ